MRCGAPEVAARHSSRLQSRYPERVGVEAPAVLGTELVAVLGQIGAEELEIAGAAHPVAHRVDPQLECGQAQ